MFYGAAALCLIAALLMVGAEPLAWPALAAVAAHFAWQVRTLAADDPVRALRLFRSNATAGFLVFLACFVATVS